MGKSKRRRWSKWAKCPKRPRDKSAGGRGKRPDLKVVRKTRFSELVCHFVSESAHSFAQKLAVGHPSQWAHSELKRYRGMVKRTLGNSREELLRALLFSAKAEAEHLGCAVDTHAQVTVHHRPRRRSKQGRSLESRPFTNGFLEEVLGERVEEASS